MNNVQIITQANINPNSPSGAQTYGVSATQTQATPAARKATFSDVIYGGSSQSAGSSQKSGAVSRSTDAQNTQTHDTVAERTNATRGDKGDGRLDELRDEIDTVRDDNSSKDGLDTEPDELTQSLAASALIVPQGEIVQDIPQTDGTDENAATTATIADVIAPSDAIPDELQAAIDAAIAEREGTAETTGTTRTASQVEEMSQVTPETASKAETQDDGTMLAESSMTVEQTAQPTGNTQASDSDSGDTDSNERGTESSEPTATTNVDGSVFTRTVTQNVAGTEMTTTETTVSVPVNKLFDTLVQAATLSKTGSTSEMTLQLKPEHLGKVQLQLSLTSEGVAVKITAEDPNVKGMLNSQLTQLIETITSKGVKITAAEVVYSETANTAFGENARGGESNEQRQKRRQYTVPVDVATFGGLDGTPYFYYGEDEDVAGYDSVA